MKKIVIEHYATNIGVRKNVICIMPEEIDQNTSCLTLLHGLSDNEYAFLDYTNIYHLAEKYNLLVILPSAERSFYTNMANGIKYFDYVTKEIYEIVKATLNIDIDKMNNYIGGFSMGGYGAIKAALMTSRYDGVFSFAGALDLKVLEKEVVVGDGLFSSVEWNNVFPNGVNDTNDVLDMNIENIKPLLIVGDKDFLYEHSLKFKEIYGDKCELIIRENEGHDWFFINHNLEFAIKKIIQL